MPSTIVAVLVALTTMAASGGAWSAEHTITMEAVGYAPSALTVRRGDTVVWINRDPFPHTATAADRSFDSREIAAGASWKYVARKRGKIDYLCTLHPNMKGTLIVE